LACALPLGFTSECEILDAWLENDNDRPKIISALRAALPPGIEINQVDIIEDQTPALQTQVESAVYLVTFLDEITRLSNLIESILSAEHLFRQRRNKSYDLRPLIEGISCLPCDGRNQQLRLQLSVRESATGRPEEVLDAMNIKFENTRVHREELILKKPVILESNDVEIAILE
jgi:radical SAM-linked protein